MIREILRMGDPRLLERSREVERFGTKELQELLADMRDTMREADGAGLAAPQIGVPLRVVIFSVEANPRYYHTVYGQLPTSHQAHDEILGALPAGWPYSKVASICNGMAIRNRLSITDAINGRSCSVSSFRTMRPVSTT